MRRILFQPFDAKKWFVVGFAAWLSQLSGGASLRVGEHLKWQSVPGFDEFRDTLSEIPHWVLVSGLIFLVALMLALVFVFAWLRARGRFMFVDGIVKNRGAIAEPWREFRSEGNSYFLFALVVGFAVVAVLIVAALPFLLPIIRKVTFLHLHDVYLFSMIALWAMLCLVLLVGWNLVLHLMLPIMYRRRCGGVEACRAALALIRSFPGEIALYCLFWILLGMGAAVAACATVLFTCCIALLPYIGTVIMLPIFVCLRAYGLCFIRQFGPDYDVWSATAQPPPLPPTEPSVPV
jgi:hypothetical protein